MNKTLIGWFVGLVVIAAAAGTAYYFYHQHRGMHPAQQTVATKGPEPASTAPVIRHPISQASSAAAPATSTSLPPLDRSDATVTDALASLTGAAHLHGLLIPHDIIQRFVATVDALPRQDIGNQILPLKTPKGMFQTRQVNGKTVISPANYKRYQPYMQMLEQTDAKTLVDWYVQHYPLFQEAYQQLGYPHGYFNDRLIQVIDNLLATPETVQPPELQQPHVLYTYANPDLQGLSVGQKMLLRAGPANEARIKAKLRAIRSDLIGRQLPAAAATVVPASSTAPAATASAAG